MTGSDATATRPASRLIDSRAFREASLKSETRRAYATIGLACVAALLVILPNFGRALAGEIRVAGTIGIICLVIVQFIVLGFIRWARLNDRMIPFWLEAATLVFESLIPTGIIGWHFYRGGMPPYALLNSPPILVYGLLITLSTLRLRPALCILAGVVSAAGYAGALLYVMYVMGIRQPTTGMPLAGYFNSGALIFISGFGAAWVAHEIRKHMEAALGEAETRHQIARIQQDLSIARSIQQALIPRNAPAIAGYDIAGWNRSADQTGGDYYDWQPLPDGNWIVSLADVSGHGIGPAMVTAACRAYVRASSHYHADLSSLISRINRLLADDLEGGRFVTMVSVLIDPTGGPLHLLSAGHSPIVLYVGATSSVQDILPQDLPLAVESDARFGPSQPITLAAGDVLALVTDGFVEWARKDAAGHREEFGLARLRESLSRHAALPAAAIIQAVAADVAAFAGAVPQQDDLTMVIVKRVSSA